MEVSFRPVLKSYITTQSSSVSILVLMEVSFRHYFFLKGILGMLFGFNPCFNGSIFQTGGDGSTAWSPTANCFNPCFNGSIFQTECITAPQKGICSVSILVLMEVSFRQEMSSNEVLEETGFNPCFNGSIFQTRYIIPKSTRISLFQSLF